MKEIIIVALAIASISFFIGFLAGIAFTQSRWLRENKKNGNTRLI